MSKSNKRETEKVIEALKGVTKQPAESVEESINNLFEFIFERMRYDLRIIQAALYKPHKDQDIYDMLQELIDKL